VKRPVRRRFTDRAPIPAVAVREFSRVPLRCGHERQIAILSRAGDQPALAITCFVANGEQIARTIFRGPHEVEVLSAAIRLARGPSLRGRANAGILHHGANVRLHVWACANTGKPAAVCFARRTADGCHIGGPTALDGDELDALEQAARCIRRIMRHATHDEVATLAEVR
jgi:hypothetical protein